MGFPILVRWHLYIDPTPRFLASPRHQQPCYWICTITWALLSKRKNVNRLSISQINLADVLTHGGEWRINATIDDTAIGSDWFVPSHYLNQCWHVGNWTVRNKHHSNVYQNTLFPYETMNLKMSSEKMAAMFYRPQCVEFVTYPFLVVDLDKYLVSVRFKSNTRTYVSSAFNSVRLQFWAP